ncbi:MAG TPA: dihydroorotase [Syntrophales bacterium]|jgi:dihydroorotase|nr:dihydroorotase [Syntrophales bacterium]HPC33179.1 dihydroorotase [Syntrophales bacterium]HQG34547.1 dihydroorotase [Syntrophales bacterium]HRR47795.1 dihydroorotase [Syntrophales bacterium]HRU89151.1 dihydroorotase [Syntrophales bacterium]
MEMKVSDHGKSWLLRGARIVDPSRPREETLDILIENGRIAHIGRKPAGTRINGLQILELDGLIVTPGLIDMHVHLREPGFEYKETIATGSAAAAAGGFTAVACMPNTDPVNDSRSVTEFILRKAEEADLVHVYPVAAITARSQGKTLAEYWDLKEAGSVALSDDGKPVMDSAVMRRALEYAHSLGLPVLSHCEDLSLSAAGAIHEGLAATELGLPGIPGIAEEIMVARDLLLAEYTGAAIHICHVSSAGSVRLIREAKSRGVRVTAETAPHYFTLTVDSLRGYDVNAKVNPPLREERDVEAIREGLRDGTIDAIASDHAPHAVTDKEVEFEYAAGGMIGLETSLALSLRLVADGLLSLKELIAKMSSRPAAILGVPGGRLAPGEPADLTVIDLTRPWKVTGPELRSRSKNTPFLGWQLTGKAVLTMKGGRATYSDLPGTNSDRLAGKHTRRS